MRETTGVSKFARSLEQQIPRYAQDDDEFAMNLADGIRRARYRDSWEKPSLMLSTVYQVIVDASPSNLFKRGHRIRLDVSSSNFPHFDANPNTGEPEGQARRTKVATNRVYTNATRSSRVILPIIPSSSRASLGMTVWCAASQRSPLDLVRSTRLR